MSKFLIEVPHKAELYDCARVVHVFQTSGSHFLTHADWGCQDGVHSAWMIVEVHSRDEARAIIPPAFRQRAKVIALNKFTSGEIDSTLSGQRL
jgi:hypothetical protein